MLLFSSENERVILPLKMGVGGESFTLIWLNFVMWMLESWFWNLWTFGVGWGRVSWNMLLINDSDHDKLGSCLRLLISLFLRVFMW